MLLGFIYLSEIARQSTYKVFGTESFTQSLCLKAFQALILITFVLGGTIRADKVYKLKIQLFDYPFALVSGLAVGGWRLTVGG
jgi:cytochrome bd-type quinol oxidase subunit 2